MFSSNVVLEEFVCRILDKSFFNTRRVTRGKMCVLEGFRFFKMCLYIKDRFFLESSAFVYNRVLKTPVYDICTLHTADCRPQTADCMKQQDCKLNETKNIVIKVASSSTLPCFEKYMQGLEAKCIFFTQITPTSFLKELLDVLLVLN